MDREIEAMTNTQRSPALDPTRALVQIHHVDERSEAGEEATLERVGLRDAVLETGREDLAEGEIIHVQIAFPELLRPISAEARITDRDLSATRPLLRCRWTRVGPGGARVLLQLSKSTAVAAGRARNRSWQTAC